MAQKKIDIYANFQPTSIDNTGAQSMQALAGLAESVGDVAFQIGKQKRTEEGAAAGALAGQEAVETGELGDVNAFSFYGQAFKQERDRAYLSGLNSSMEQDLSAAFAQAEVASNSLETFDTLSQAWYAGTSKNASENAIPLIKGTFDNVAGAYRTRLIAAEAKQVAEDNITANALLLSNLGDSAINIASNGNIPAADEARITYMAALQGDPNQTLENKIKLSTDYNATYEAAQATGGMRKVFSSQGVASAVDFVQAFADIDNPIMTPQMSFDADGELVVSDKTMLPANREKVIDILQKDLRDMITLQDAKDDEAAKIVEANQNNRSLELSIQIAQGSVTTAQITNDARLGLITESQFQSAIKQLQSQGRGVDDYSLIGSIDELIEGEQFDKAFKLISDNVGINLTSKTAISLQTRLRAMQVSENVLTQPTVVRLRKTLVGIMQSKNQFDMPTFDNPALSTNILDAFDERVLAGEKPRTVLNELRQVYKYKNPGVMQGAELTPYKQYKTLIEAKAEVTKNINNEVKTKLQGISDADKRSLIIENGYEDEKTLLLKIDNLFRIKELETEFEQLLKELEGTE